MSEERIKTNKELGLPPMEVGQEWDAGFWVVGRWTVRKGSRNWIVLFHYANGEDELISLYPLTDDGERQAKQRAINSYLYTMYSGENRIKHFIYEL